MVVDYLYIKVTDLMLLSALGWQVLCCASPPVYLCLYVITGACQELYLLVRLSTAIFTSSQAMHLGDADGQILSCGNSLVLFLKHPVPGTGKEKLQGQRDKSKNSEVFSGLTVKLTVILDVSL